MRGTLWIPRNRGKRRIMHMMNTRKTLNSKLEGFIIVMTKGLIKDNEDKEVIKHVYEFNEDQEINEHGED